MDKTPDMIAAVRAKDIRTVKRLIAEDPALASARSETGESAVLVAIYAGANEIAALLIHRGADLDVFDAAAAGSLEALERRIAENPKAAGAFAGDGWTPLHLAAFFGHTAAVRLLLDRGADPHAVSRNPTANTALHAATVRGHRDAAQALIAKGADVNRAAGGGWTPLHLAAGTGHVEVAELLIASGAALDMREDRRKTPLEIAEETAHPKVAAMIRRRLR
jgi:ankyrin repeat protein